jgi:hypothetical protein
VTTNNNKKNEIVQPDINTLLTKNRSLFLKEQNKNLSVTVMDRQGIQLYTQPGQLKQLIQHHCIKTYRHCIPQKNFENTDVGIMERTQEELITT